jgi:hypothetical protein
LKNRKDLHEIVGEGEVISPLTGHLSSIRNPSNLSSSQEIHLRLERIMNKRKRIVKGRSTLINSEG